MMFYKMDGMKCTHRIFDMIMALMRCMNLLTAPPAGSTLPPKSRLQLRLAFVTPKLFFTELMSICGFHPLYPTTPKGCKKTHHKYNLNPRSSFTTTAHFNDFINDCLKFSNKVGTNAFFF